MPISIFYNDPISFLYSTFHSGNIVEMKAKLQRLESFINELPSKIGKIKATPRKWVEQLHERELRKNIAENKMEGGDYPQSPVDLKLLGVLLLPFLPVFLYSVIVFFSSVFFFIYFLAILLYFALLVGKFDPFMLVSFSF